jgi:glycyl-tRNA synthetase beta chain
LAALSEIATLRGAVDSFFDTVMVMTDDENLRTNRLALLTGIARLFANIADFSKISA